MKLPATLAAVAALSVAPPAHAGVVAQLKIGSSLGDLVAGPDGGAWVRIDRPGGGAVGRAGPDGSFRTAATGTFADNGVVGPDGTAWYQSPGPGFLRADANDSLSRIRARTDEAMLGETSATGPDGTMWLPTYERDGFWHVAPDGTVTRTPARLPAPCPAGLRLTGMVRAADDAMWLIDRGCRRLLRVSPAATTTVALKRDPDKLAADGSGGVWVSAELQSNVAHVDAAGAVTSFELSDEVGYTYDVSVAPDGSAWFTAPGCRLARVTSAGQITTSRSPIKSYELAFDPAGGLWLASQGRLAHLAPGERAGACDKRPPAVRVGPGRDGGSISLRGLRRAGFTVRVDEPAEITAAPTYREHARRDGTLGTELVRTLRGPRGGTLRYRVPPKQLRRFARVLASGGKPSILFAAVASDVEGNSEAASITVRIKP